MGGAIAQWLELDSRPRIHFSMNGGLVSRQTRVQLPDSYICAKLVDFALSAVEKWLAISMILRLIGS